MALATASNMLVASIANSIAQAVVYKTIEPAVLPMLKMGVHLMARQDTLTGLEKKAILISAIERIARGADDVHGTADDVIPPLALAALRTLIESKVIDELIDMIHHSVVDLKSKLPESSSVFCKCLSACFAR